MGYDIHGNQPTAPEGKHYRCSVWDWPYVAELCQHLAPEETAPCEIWAGENCYGHGLDAVQALKLADKLHMLLSSGSVAAYLDDMHAPERREYCDEDHIYVFVGFLRACGGFTIT
jgi:hypothetical protein